MRAYIHRHIQPFVQYYPCSIFEWRSDKYTISKRKKRKSTSVKCILSFGVYVFFSPVTRLDLDSACISGFMLISSFSLLCEIRKYIYREKFYAPRAIGIYKMSLMVFGIMNNLHSTKNMHKSTIFYIETDG